MKALKAFICHNYLYVYLLELYNYTGKKTVSHFCNIFVHFCKFPYYIVTFLVMNNCIPRHNFYVIYEKLKLRKPN